MWTLIPKTLYRLPCSITAAFQFTKGHDKWKFLIALVHDNAST